jgi:hypothetical protein
MEMSRIAIACLLVGGCAGIDCQGTDWYALGQRDGMLDARSQIERYLDQCGNAADAARWQAGFNEAFARRPRPVSM